MKQCEYEDSTNCIWDAENQGNGEGYSFVDIDGSVHYTDDPTVYEDVWVDGWMSFPYQYVIAQVEGEDYMVITWEGETTYTCPEGKAPGWLNEYGEPTSCVDKVDYVEVATVETVQQEPVLAETGAGDVVLGLLAGAILVVSGIVLMNRGKR